jgi:hypothetical protein
MIYTPVDTGIPMRPVIDRDEALRLVEDIPGIAPCMCPTHDKKAVREHYAHLMQPNTCRAYAETLVASAQSAAASRGGRPRARSSWPKTRRSGSAMN